MVKDGKGKVVPVGKARTRYITIPAEVAGDDRFPFSDNEEVSIAIHPDKKCLTVKKIE